MKFFPNKIVDATSLLKDLVGCDVNVVGILLYIKNWIEGFND